MSTTNNRRRPTNNIRDVLLFLATCQNRKQDFAALTALTPSAQLIWLWLVERSLALGFFEIFGIWRLTRLGLGRFGYGQRLGLGYAPLPNNHFAHTHTGFPVVWGGCKKPPRNDKYFPIRFRAAEFSGCRTLFEHSITQSSCLVHATLALPVRQ